MPFQLFPWYSNMEKRFMKDRTEVDPIKISFYSYISVQCMDEAIFLI
jgi:hypothetical protein